MEVDHVTSLANGGDAWALANLQTLCYQCHWAKTRIDVGGRDRPELRRWAALLRESFTAAMETSQNSS